jgi:hypothetical protein
MRWVLDLLAFWLQDTSDLQYELKSKVDDLTALKKYSTSPFPPHPY